MSLPPLYTKVHDALKMPEVAIKSLHIRVGTENEQYNGVKLKWIPHVHVQLLPVGIVLKVTLSLAHPGAETPPIALVATIVMS